VTTPDKLQKEIIFQPLFASIEILIVPHLYTNRRWIRPTRREQIIKIHGEEYLKYRGRVSFMIPLPEGLKRLLTAPVKLLLGKEMPKRGRKITLVLTLYGLILISPSIP